MKRLPHIYVILVCMLLFIAFLTFFIPSGEFYTEESSSGETIIKVDTYHKIDSQSLGFKDLMTSIPEGFVQSADIIIFVLSAGGAFGVISKTNIISIGIDRLSRNFSKRPPILIILLMAGFGIVSTLVGLPELNLVYVPVILPLVINLGYDSLTAVAITFISTTAGFAASVTNPLVGISQRVAEVPLFSQAGFRTIIFFTLLIPGILYVLRYASKVRKVTVIGLNQNDAPDNVSKRHKFAFLIIVLMLVILVSGVLVDDWYMIEIAGFFILLSLVIGFVTRMKLDDICNNFTEGCKTVFIGAFIIGISRAIVVVMEQGKIIDTIIYGLWEGLESFPNSITVLGMFLGNSLLNFLIPSGSGQALVAIPIMAPLGDILGITRQTVVVAFHLGDGLSNIFYPTVGYFMATLAIAKVSWIKWIKFFIPLALIWTVLSFVILLTAQAIQLGT